MCMNILIYKKHTFPFTILIIIMTIINIPESNESNQFIENGVYCISTNNNNNNKAIVLDLTPFSNYLCNHIMNINNINNI
jgi:hypothetical protein